MRFKYFLTIFLALSVTAAAVSAIHFYFFRGERLRLIELNLQQNASLLRNTDLELSKVEFTSRGNELVEKVIGDDRINMIVGIYTEAGQLLYENDNARVFGMPETIDGPFQEWEDVETPDYYVKYLTLRDRDQDRIIRVGMILNQSLLRWRDLNQRIFVFVGLVLLIVSLISFLLTEALFRPVGLISKDVKLMATKIDAGEFRELKSWFTSMRSRKRMYRDEFSNLLGSLDLLAEKVSESQLQTQKWAALMAHELKTPMTRLKNSVDGYTARGEEKYLRAIEAELSILDAIVMDFLAWASLENDQSKPELHAISLGKRLQTIVNAYAREAQDFRIEVVLDQRKDVRLFCNPLHLDQVITNLVSNAIKYSAGHRLRIEVRENELRVRDFGGGIPQTVLDNLGKPFNRFNAKGVEGHGLGLAWVKTICTKYGWHLGVSNCAGAQVVINFGDTYA